MEHTEPSELKLTYNQTSGKICLETYDEGFFNQEIDYIRSGRACRREAI